MRKLSKLLVLSLSLVLVSCGEIDPNKNNNVNVPNPLNTSEVENKTKKIASRINETNIIIIGIIILSKV